MKEYDDPENEMSVTFDRRNWFRVIAAMHHGLDEIPNEEQREFCDALIDEIVDQAEITIVEMMDLEAELRSGAELNYSR